MKIVLIGAGNVAHHIGIALQNEGHKIEQVFSRTMKSAVELASKFNSSFTTELVSINPNADMYIIAVSDRAIETIVREFPYKDKLMVHTAGSVDISVFEGYAKNYGVMYPLQTFSKFKEILFHEIPIFIEANNQENETIIFELAKQLSPKVSAVNSKQRMILHLCGVFASNFSNHMCSIAENLLKQNNLQYEVLRPLLRETYEKISNYSPQESQTGPAVRNDVNIVNKHIELLASFPTFVVPYKILSDSIREMHNK
jgi:predicted short-subunit dehydrogenase-like oxidoreductase (DUF2520 family)